MSEVANGGGASAATAARVRRQSLGYRLRQSWVWYLFVAPNVLTFIAFTLFSWIFLIFLSFQDWNLIGAREYAGLENYQRMLNDAVLRRAVVNTFYYVVLFVPPVSVVSLALAVLVNRRLRGMNALPCLLLPARGHLDRSHCSDLEIHSHAPERGHRQLLPRAGRLRPGGVVAERPHRHAGHHHDADLE